jgi:hypothetical protein
MLAVWLIDAQGYPSRASHSSKSLSSRSLASWSRNSCTSFGAADRIARALRIVTSLMGYSAQLTCFQ